jgi:hypothetical protein
LKKYHYTNFSRSHETAYYALKNGGCPSIINSLDKFLDHHIDRLRQCHQIIVKPTKVAVSAPASQKSWEREKIGHDRDALVALLSIDAAEALRIVLHGHLRGTLSDSKRNLHHARLYLTEQRHLVKIVQLLFLYRNQNPENLPPNVHAVVKKYSTSVLADPDFFEQLVNVIIKNFENPFFIKSEDPDLSALFDKEVCFFFSFFISVFHVLLLTSCSAYFSKSTCSVFSLPRSLALFQPSRASFRCGPKALLKPITLLILLHPR